MDFHQNDESSTRGEAMNDSFYSSNNEARLLKCNGPYTIPTAGKSTNRIIVPTVVNLAPPCRLGTRKVYGAQVTTEDYLLSDKDVPLDETSETSHETV